jgi:RNA polymerase sigma-B factor
VVYRESGDASVRAKLVTNYMPLVRRLCRKFSSSREPQDDLFQVGLVGLLNSIEKFDPQRGSSFSSLAIPEIMGAILNYLRDHGSLLKIPRGVRRNKLTMDKTSESMAITLGRWPSTDEIAESSDLTNNEVIEAAVLGRTGDPRSLDEALESDESDDSFSLSDYVGYEDAGYDISLDRLTLATSLDTLPEREKLILQLRYYRALSQRQTAEIVSISQMHVSRLERAALNKLRLVLQRNSNGSAARDGDTVTRARSLPAAS